MNNFNYSKAKTAGEAANQSAQTQKAAFIGGGTNLLDLWKYNLTHPQTLIDINGLENGREITALPAGGIRLGAQATNSTTAHHPLVEAQYPLLSKTILAGASGQIRNMATNGGNLLQRTRCYYFYQESAPCNKRNPGSGCGAIAGQNRMHAILGHSDKCIAVFPSDMCVALAALEAVVQVEGPAGSRSIPFAEFHRLPGELPELDNTLQPHEVITAIDLPAEGFAQNYCYLKLRDRLSYAFAMVSVAVGLKLEGGKIVQARIALGGVAAKPWRVPAAEEYLAGKEPTDAHFAEAANQLLAGAVGFEHNHFKIGLTHRAILRACRMALKPELQRPGAKPSL